MNVMELIVFISTDFSDLVLLILRLLSSQCNVGQAIDNLSLNYKKNILDLM